MKKFFDRFMQILEKYGGKLQQMTYLIAIKDAFTDLMPIIIIGSFATLISNVICSPKNGLAQFAGFGFLEQFTSIFSTINYATMSFLAIYLVYRIGHKMAEIRGTAPVLSGFVALACYVTLLPTSVQTSAGEELITLSNVVSAGYTNSQGMFMAIIVGIASAELFSALIKSGKLQIKMPDSVPAGVSRSFEVLFPAMITALIFGVIGFLFVKGTGYYIPDMITKTLQAPMESIMQHPAGVIVLALVCQLFWMIGIHGSQMIGVVRNTIGMAAIAANLAAYEAGLPMPNIFTYTFWNTYVTIGGCGNTIGLVIAIYLFSKREDNRSMAKLSTIPMIFGINEPMIFGMPIVLNPLLAIPFILAPMVTAAIGYVATAIGFAGAAFITVPFTVPPILNAYLTTAGSIGAVITQILCIVVSVVIYIPFVKLLNKQGEEA
ncbi:PTS sugar transporter subunit IIC [Holdemania massiliensis]|uniref:PTS sugar transporter subunit IIC n=1 Tax=Holdemania massiliensis TaxID=1468449 RepID=UPI001F054DC4|nr:PTS transporter subunit EIIC [Holdemania massiliensis]MCH1942468.1 PTS transporter subunit EIIC [Holdemania massiliensis]